MNEEVTTQDLLLAAEVRKLAVGRAMRAAREAAGDDAVPTQQQWKDAIKASIDELRVIAGDIKSHPRQLVR
jgi:hypothetical protein